MAWRRTSAARPFSRALAPLSLAFTAWLLGGCRVRILDRSESDERSPLAADDAVTARTWDHDTTPFPFRPTAARMPPFDELDAGVARLLTTSAPPRTRAREGVGPSSDAGVPANAQRRAPSTATSTSPGTPRRSSAGASVVAPNALNAAAPSTTTVDTAASNATPTASNTPPTSTEPAHSSAPRPPAAASPQPGPGVTATESTVKAGPPAPDATTATNRGGSP